MILTYQITFFNLSVAKDLILILKYIVEDLKQFIDVNKNELILAKLKNIETSYANFIYSNSRYYSKPIETISDHKGIEDDSQHDIIALQKEIISEKKKTGYIINLGIEFIAAIIDDDIENLMTAKQEYCRVISNYIEEEQQIKLEKYTKIIYEKLHNIISNDDNFSTRFEAVSKDFTEYVDYLKSYQTLLTSLSSAEFLYDRYITKMSEKKNFDYSCISIMYYKTLEDFINKFLYIPYKNEVLKNNKEEALNTKLYLNNPEFYYKYEKFKTSCELGPLSFLCADVKIIPKFRDYLKNKYHFDDSYKSFDRLEIFGKKLQKKSENRNNAAHGGKIISYETAKDDKTTVYPTESPEEIRGLLKEFLDIIFHKD